MQRKDIELMAPAGSFATLHAAIQGKADAIYFGVGKLNMRSGSSMNFTQDNLGEIIDICIDKGLKSYMTLNTVVYDNDFDLMEESLNLAKDKKVTAVIASDIAVLSKAREIGLNVHASTQLNISNIRAVEFYSKFTDVMVLARELKLTQVKEIYQQIQERNICGPSGKQVRLEVFAHGALCMAVSGKCYLSLALQDKSANRGECLQPCRRQYVVTEKEKGYSLEVDNEYIMSPQDLCTIGFLDKVLDAGARILKIEGRGRPADYVKRTCECYNEAINEIVEGTYTHEKAEALKSRLSEVYNRGFWDGYYMGQTFGEWNNVHGSRATKRKVYVGTVKNYYSKIGVAEIAAQADGVNLGDDLMIIGETTGCVEINPEKLRYEEQNVEKIEKGQIFTIELSEPVRRNDKLYKVVDGE